MSVNDLNDATNKKHLGKVQDLPRTATTPVLEGLAILARPVLYPCFVMYIAKKGREGEWKAKDSEAEVQRYMRLLCVCNVYVMSVNT